MMSNILGVDIGGSKIRMVLWNGTKVLKEWQSETANLENLKKGLEFFNKALGSAYSKVGVGLPGLLDFKNNQALFCKNLPAFNKVNLKACFPVEVNPHTKQSYGVGVKTDNDAKCFLRAELNALKGEKPNHALGIIFGTGIGGAFTNEKLKTKNEKFEDEVIYKGKDGWAGEFGHMIIEGGRTLRQAQGRTWEKLYQETKNNPKEQEKINAQAIANLINIFNPEVIILGGKGAVKPNLKIIEKYLLVKEKQMPKFIFSKLKENAVAMGAALLWE